MSYRNSGPGLKAPVPIRDRIKMKHLRLTGPSFLIRLRPRMRYLNYAGRSLLSFASFNLGWWACALGPKYQIEWLGPVFMPLWLGLHIYFSPTKLGEALFFTLLAVLGFAIDTGLIYAGIFRINPETVFTPAWLVCMWMLLGLTFESMLVMRRNIWLVCLMGVLSGPLSYLFAQAVNILNYSEPRWVSMILHALLWAAMMPLLFALRDYSIRWSLHRKAE